jgi:hypothetical protein
VRRWIQWIRECLACIINSLGQPEHGILRRRSRLENQLGALIAPQQKPRMKSRYLGVFGPPFYERESGQLKGDHPAAVLAHTIIGTRLRRKGQGPRVNQPGMIHSQSRNFDEYILVRPTRVRDRMILEKLFKNSFLVGIATSHKTGAPHVTKDSNSGLLHQLFA